MIRKKLSVLNIGKCFLYTLEKVRKMKLFPLIANIIFNNSKEKIMLGITINKKLTLKSHIRCLCKKSLRKKGLFKTATSSK